MIVQQRWGTGELLRRISRFCEERSAEEMVDRVEFLSSWGEA
jgi:hypothetical protein